MIDLTEYAKQRYKNPVIIKKNYTAKLQLIADMFPCGNLILELGCGDGILTSMLNKHNKVIGIDLEKGEIQCDLQTSYLPFHQECFDGVVAVELIEHIFDIDRLLGEIHRVIKKHGLFVLSTPNLASLGRRLMLLAGKNPYVENFLYPTDAGHVKHYVRKDLKYLLTKNGFKVNKIIGDTVMLSQNGNWHVPLLAKLFPNLSRCLIAICQKS